MSDRQHYDIVIVGGGLVGAALALSLRDIDCSIAIIDTLDPSSRSVPDLANNAINQFQPRVSALTLASVEQLSELGVWQLVAPHLVQAYQQMTVWDELGTAEIHFDSTELYQDQLGYIIENDHLLAAMHSLLSNQANVTGIWNEKVDRISCSDNANTIYLKDSSLSTTLLIGADGANSRIRQMANLPTREWDYEHHAIVCTVKSEQAHSNTARQRFSEFGPLAFLPLKDADNSGQYCSIVWSIKSSESDRLMSLDDKKFSKELEQVFECRLGQIQEVSKRFTFPLRQRHAKSYYCHSVALVGDAAHTIHPLAGQGVNLGFKDIHVLSRLITEASNQGLPINHATVLKRYQRERQGDNLVMMGAMEGFKQLFGSPSPLIRWARNTGLDFVNKQSLIKNQLAKHAMGLL